MADNKYLVPIAIVFAGVMIAGAIYLGGSGGGIPTTPQPSSPTAEIDISPVTADDHIRGSRSAPVVIVEYSDIECPFCKIFHETMKEIVSTYDGQVAWVYRHLPIPQLHQKAIPEAIATECAAEQGGNDVFWEYTDRVFDATNSNDSLDLARLPEIAGGMGLDVEAFNSCLESGRYDEFIENSIEEAFSAGARGTPYSVVILDDALSTNQVKALTEVLSSRGMSPDAITISNDKKRIALGGAFPLDLMTDILNTFLR